MPGDTVLMAPLTHLRAARVAVGLGDGACRHAAEIGVAGGMGFTMSVAVVGGARLRRQKPRRQRSNEGGWIPVEDGLPVHLVVLQVHICEHPRI